MLLADLRGAKTQQIRSAIEDGKTFLAICGGYQMLGQYYKTWDGVQCDFTGALDLYTVGRKQRMIGNYMFTCDELPGVNVVGFENHSGKTYLGSGAVSYTHLDVYKRQALSHVMGQVAISLSSVGVLACATASPGPPSPLSLIHI